VIEIPVFEMPSAYTVCALPASMPAAWRSSFTITVEHWDGDLWQIRWVGYYMAPDGMWVADRDRAVRADRETALAMARKAAPDIRVGDLTAREVTAARWGAET
jgi:hypothetical protein